MSKIIEIPFGAKDSELKGWEYTIPKGMEAVIEGGKVIVRVKESEDERIRKAILGLTYLDGIEPILTKCSITAGDIRAYIEKQKEQKPNIELIKRSWYMEGYTDGEFKREPMWNLVTGEGGPRYEKNEKYGQPLEQKPVEWSEEDEMMLANVFGTYKTLEDMLDLSTGQDRDILENMNFEKDWLRDRFKSLRPQPKQEWSEEDEENISKLHRLLVICQGEKKFIPTSEYEKLDRWLKSLRPPRNWKEGWCNDCKVRYNHWKPSEEQMEWLESAVKLSTDKPHIHGIIISLYEQLKRL